MLVAFALWVLIRISTVHVQLQRGEKHATCTTIRIEGKHATCTTIRIEALYQDRMRRRGGRSMTPASKRSKKSNASRQGIMTSHLCNETPLTQANILTIVQVLASMSPPGTMVHPTDPDGDHMPVVSSSATPDVNSGAVSSTTASAANTLRSLSSGVPPVTTNSLPHHSRVQPSVTLPLLTNSSTSDNSSVMMVSHQPTTDLRQPLPTAPCKFL